MQQNDQRPIAIAGLDVMQAHVPDLGLTLPKLDSDGTGASWWWSKDLLGWGLAIRLRPPVWVSNECYHSDTIAVRDVAASTQFTVRVNPSLIIRTPAPMILER